MSTREELSSVLEVLPDWRIQEVLDFARFLRMQEHGDDAVAATEPMPKSAPEEVLATTRELSPEEREVLIREEIELASQLPEAPDARPFKFDREATYADRLLPRRH